MPARVPAGSALAVDREIFADEITRRIEAEPADRDRARRGRKPRPFRPATRDRRERAADLACALRGPPLASSSRSSLLLRCDLADRHRRVDRPHGRHSRPRVTEGRRRLPQLPARAARSTSASSTRCSAPRRCRRANSRQCIYFEGCMPIEELGSARAAHARVRADASGRPRRPADRQTAARRRAAPAGRPSTRRSIRWSAFRPR